MGSDGTTIGIWVSERNDIVERFDDVLGTRDSNYSRSESIKEAMELYLTVEETLAELDYNFPAEQSKRHFVRQAILEQARREADRDD